MKFIIEQPLSTDFVQYYGSTLKLIINVFDVNGNPFDFTGYTGTFNIRANRNAATVLLNLTLALSTGQILIMASAATLMILAQKSYSYDMVLSDSLGNIDAWLVGGFILTRSGVSTDADNELNLTFQNNVFSLYVTTQLAGNTYVIDCGNAQNL